MATYQTNSGYGVDWRDEYGRRHRRFIGERADADRFDAIMRNQAAQARAQLTNARNSTQLDLATGLELFLNSNKRAPATTHKIRVLLKPLTDLCGNMNATDVTPQLLEQWRTTVRQRLAPSSMAHASLYVKNLFRFLTRQWGLTTSPAEWLPTEQPRQSAGKALSTEEQQQILALCPTPATRAKVLLGLDAGFRAGEFKLLRWSAINWTKREILAWPSKRGSPRIVPATHRLLAALRAVKPTIAEPDQYVFPGRKDKLTSRITTLRTILLQGGPRCRFHDLRHTFASRLAEKNVPEHTIAALLGHAPRTSTQVYLHPTRERLGAAIATLEPERQKISAERLEWKNGRLTLRNEAP